MQTCVVPSGRESKVCLHGNSSCRLEALQHVRMAQGSAHFAIMVYGSGIRVGRPASALYRYLHVEHCLAQSHMQTRP